MSRLKGLALVVLSCATLQTFGAQVATLQSDAARCQAYAPFHAQAAQLEKSRELEPSAAQAIADAKRRCARAVLTLLAESAASVSDYRRELEALTQDFRGPSLGRLVADTLGPRADELRAEVALAQASADLNSASSTPVVMPRETNTCTGSALERLACLRHTGGNPSVADDVVMQAEPGLDVLPQAIRLESTAALLKAATGVASSKALSPLQARLDAGCAVRVELVTSLNRSGQTLRAATLAKPCLAHTSARAALADGVREAERRRAQAFRSGRTFAAWLWAGVQAQFLEQPSPRTVLQRSAWPLAGTCIAQTPAPPLLPLGVAAQVSVRCEVRTSSPKERPQTFDGEAEAEQEAVVGELRMACGSQVRRFAVRAAGVRMSMPGTEPERAVLAEVGNSLRRIATEAGDWCTQLKATEAATECATWTALPAEEVEQRYAENALVAGRWAPCFVEHFAQLVGAELPTPVTLLR
jgi:hypothetical protein